VRWLKNTTVALLLVAAAAIALATALGDHSDDYGQVSVSQGGTVQLPKGTVNVFYRAPGQSASNSQLANPLSLQVVPAGGGEPLRESSSTNGTSDVVLASNQDVSTLGSSADIDVPASGAYVVSASSGQDLTGSSITFGTTTSQAFVDRWKLLAALVGSALLLALLPIPRRRKAWEDTPESSWSTNPRSPYAG
jgi:hypothetical protein